MHSSYAPTVTCAVALLSIATLTGTAGAQAPADPQATVDRMTEQLQHAAERITGAGLDVNSVTVVEVGCLRSKPVPAACWIPGRRAIEVTQALIDHMSGNSDLLAFVLAHEIAHGLLRHPSTEASVAGAALSRQQEQQADSLGALLLVSANYSFRGAVTGLLTMLALPGQEFGPFEAMVSTHPSWFERAYWANLRADRGFQAELWGAMGAFRDGVYFLATQQYQVAERAFEAVVEEFADSHEAWANLGYARLMLYVDRLDEADVRRFDVGHLAVGGFYHRAPSLEAQVRGVDPELWWGAVDALREAVRIAEREGRPAPLARANLGLAYLLDPEGQGPSANAARAQRLLEGAVEEAENDPSLPPEGRAAILANAVAAGITAGDPLRARQLLAAMTRLLEAGRRGPGVTAAAFHEAVLLSNGGTPDQERRARVLFRDYLTSQWPGSAWWAPAYERYAEVSRRLGEPVEPAEALRAASPGARLTPATSVSLPGGGEVELNQPIEGVERVLGPGRVRVAIPGTNIRGLAYPDAGVALLAGDRVLAIFPTSPSVPVVAGAPDGDEIRLTVGMSEAALRESMGEDLYEYGYDLGAIAGGALYRYYRDLGVALRVDRDSGRVAELVVAQVPRRRR